MSHGYYELRLVAYVKMTLLAAYETAAFLRIKQAGLLLDGDRPSFVLIATDRRSTVPVSPGSSRRSRN